MRTQWLVALVAILLLPMHGIAKDRLALVIGNSAYPVEEPTPDTKIDWSLRDVPVSDAQSFGDLLEHSLGFKVIRGHNLPFTGMEMKLKEFAEAIPGKKVIVFYYSGHGAEFFGENYLVPIDTRFTSPTSKTIKLSSDVIDLIDSKLRSGPPAVKIILLDCCRDDPFKSLSKSPDEPRAGGLAAPKMFPGATIMGFAAQPGKKASIGGGKNSIYTESLLKFLKTPGEDFEEVLRKTGGDVEIRTNGGQQPWRNSSYNYSLILHPKSPPPILPSRSKTVPPVPESNADSQPLSLPVPRALDKGRIALVQETLKRCGLYDELIDGVAGTKTTSAVRSWGRREGVTLSEMDEASFAAIQKSDTTEYINPLNMKFVRIPDTKLLISIWETRVRDYRAYCIARNLPQPSEGQVSNEFFPVVRVSWQDANLFCEWLGTLDGRAYRLPNGNEWVKAVKGSRELVPMYPWGEEFPPSPDSANLGLEDSDGFDGPAPVGSYGPNSIGLYDVSGNVWELCADVATGYPNSREARGAGWGDVGRNSLRTDFRWPVDKQHRASDSVGFRVVIAEKE